MPPSWIKLHTCAFLAGTQQPVPLHQRCPSCKSRSSKLGAWAATGSEVRLETVGRESRRERVSSATSVLIVGPASFALVSAFWMSSLKKAKAACYPGTLNAWKQFVERCEFGGEAAEISRARVAVVIL